MSAGSTQPNIPQIFAELDKDADGFITRLDIEASKYADDLFDENPNALMAFNSFHDGKMNLKDFTFLYNAYRLKLHDVAIAKFEAAKLLSKYLSVSAPGAAGPSIKQSFIRLLASNDKVDNDEHMHSLGVQFGVDKPIQEQKIKQIAQALGHPPHQVFFLIKFRVIKEENGVQLAQKLQTLLHQIINVGKDLAPELQIFLSVFKVYAKYSSGYIYLMLEVDDQFVDGIVNFANEVVQAISPECSLKFKAYIKSNLKHLLKQQFSYEKSKGEIHIEFDTDSVTLHKLKQIMGDNVAVEEGSTPAKQIIMLLFEELRLSAEFNNLGEALSSTFQQNLSEIPTPATHVKTIKELGLKETIGSFFEEAPAFIEELKKNCQAEGQISLNFHDFFFKISFDLDIEDAFDLL